MFWISVCFIYGCIRARYWLKHLALFPVCRCGNWLLMPEWKVKFYTQNLWSCDLIPLDLLMMFDVSKIWNCLFLFQVTFFSSNHVIYFTDFCSCYRCECRWVCADQWLISLSISFHFNCAFSARPIFDLTQTWHSLFEMVRPRAFDRSNTTLWD